MENKKLNTEDLATVKELTSKSGYLKNRIADLEVEKAVMLNEYLNVNKSLSEFNEHLKETYGNVLINIETGEYVDNPENNEVKENGESD